MSKYIDRLAERAPGILDQDQPGALTYDAEYCEGTPIENQDGRVVARQDSGVYVAVEKHGRIYYKVRVLVPFEDAHEFLDDLESLGAKTTGRYKLVGYTSED